jgi:SAM-dependent methyltransferase
MNWDARYSEPGYAYGTAPNDFLREMAGRMPPGPVLCLAEGEGRNAVFLAELGHAVTAVDGSAVGLAKAASLARARAVGLETVHADLADFAIKEGAWAGIVTVFAHLPPTLRARMHSAVVKGLRPGGVYLLEAYTPRQLEFGTGGPPDVSLLMTADALRQELAGLELEICREIEREVVEGRFHHGRAAVVQVVGRRPT